MILKAGTYRFNGELNFDTIPFEYIETLGVYYQDVNYQLTEVIDSFSNEASFQTFSFVKYPIENGYLKIFQYIQSIDLGATTNNVLNAYLSEVGWNGEEYEVPNEKLQTHTIVKDTEVADVFGEWYIANTNYNEVNGKPLAEITYNGETIAQLNAGETAILKCGQTEDTKYVMASDVVVKVNEPPIPEGYIKPQTYVFNDEIDFSKFGNNSSIFLLFTDNGGDTHKNIYIRKNGDDYEIYFDGLDSILAYTTADGWDDDIFKAISVYYITPLTLEMFEMLVDGNTTKQ